MKIRPIWLALRGCAGAPLLFCGSCITPQIVLESDGKAIDLGEFPPGTEAVEITLEDATLRGVFVPADEAAPVVLHFLESGCSITQGSVSFPSLEAVWQLRDRGFASLAVDYQGVGASSGKRSSGNLRCDARAIFAEACRRAGGTEKRVLLRGLSIGALASASLLEDGCEPAAVVLIAPVRSESVAVHYASRTWPAPLDEILGLFLKGATDIDLMKAIGGKRVPMLVFLGERDELLPEGERRFMRYAVRSTRGRFHLRAGEDHVDTVIEAHRVLPEELEFYRELFPCLPPVPVRVERALQGLETTSRVELLATSDARPRLADVLSRWFIESPALAAALAISLPVSEASEHVRMDWFRRLPGDSWHGLPLEALTALLDTRDGEGALDLAEFPAMERLVAQWRAIDLDELSAEEIAAHARALDLGNEARIQAGGTSRYVELYEEERVVWRPSPGSDAVAPPRLRLAPEAARRQALLLLLKAAAIPARTGAAGVIEVFSDSTWRRLDPYLTAD